MTTCIPAEVISFVRRIRLGFVASVTPDGMPALSHKGTLTALDEHHLIFADIESPQTVDNLRQNSSVVVEVVDYFSRKGYRFLGTARIIGCNSLEASYISFYEEWGLKDLRERLRNFVVIEVQSVQGILSPAYAWGSKETELRDRWKTYHNNPWKF